MNKRRKPTAPIPPVRAAFSERLEAARKLAGYDSIRAGAEALGLDEGRYRRWEKGSREPDLTSIALLCRVFRVTPNQLMGFPDPQE